MSLIYRAALFVMCAAGGIGATQAEPSNPIAQVLRQESLQNNRKLNQSCALLFEANSLKMSHKDVAKRNYLIEQIITRLKNNDAEMLRARADAARLGLYGIALNEKESMGFYERAVQAGSTEAAYNLALMRFNKSGGRPDEASARVILDLLIKATPQRSGGGPAMAQAHFLAGQVYEQGWAGIKSESDAFIHYRSAARENYITATAHYLRMLAKAYQYMAPSDRLSIHKEIGMMTGRWKWASIDIMRLTGDFHALGAIPDDKDGFFAQYHWRISGKMRDAELRPDHLTMLQQRIKPMDEAAEKKLEQAVDLALKRRPAAPPVTPLKFADLCSEK